MIPPGRKEKKKLSFTTFKTPKPTLSFYVAAIKVWTAVENNKVCSRVGVEKFHKTDLNFIEAPPLPVPRFTTKHKHKQTHPHILNDFRKKDVLRIY